MAVALAVTAAIMIAQNVAIARFVPRLVRPATDFSPAYLRRELSVLASNPDQTIFLGDSVLWGYRLPPDETAVALLMDRGCACRNLAFKSGNPANDYVLTRLLLAAGVHPRAIVVEVNQAVLNWADPNYQTLHPAIATLGATMLAPKERAELAVQKAPEGPPPLVDKTLSSISLLYAMRSDIRETLYGEEPDRPIGHLKPQQFQGTYNLAQLDESNVGVRYLAKTADAIRDAGVPMIAVMTPTNHTLLHMYIDNPLYRKNELFLKRLLERRGARVIDLDNAFTSDEFFDNAHLTEDGQRRLAAALASALKQPS